MKNFCRSLEEKYEHQKVNLFLVGSVAEGFGKPSYADLDNCITDLMTDLDYMVYLEDTFAVTRIERVSDI